MLTKCIMANIIMQVVRQRIPHQLTNGRERPSGSATVQLTIN